MCTAEPELDPAGCVVRTMRGNPNLVELAHHEAGHAVAGYLSGFHIEIASIVPQTGSLGRVRPDSTSIPLNELVFTMAGPLASGRYAMQLVDFAWFPDDALGIDKQLKRHYGQVVYWPTQTRLYQDALARAQSIVAQHWNSIRRVASLLLVHKEIGHADIVTAVDAYDQRRAA